MSKKRVCLIAQFPPPMHGLSKAVDTLYNSDLRDAFDFEKVNITNNKAILKNLFLIGKSQADLFYFTISQSKGGNLRDLMILKLLSLQKKPCLIHLHGGYYRQLLDNDMPSWQRKMNYKAIGKLEGAIVLGKSLKYIFEGMLPDEKIFIVPNGVDDEYLMSDVEFDEKMATLEQRQVKHVLYLSNFIRTKGYTEVLGMACLEKERCDKGKERTLHFDFAGKFFEESEKIFFFGYIKEHKLEEYVTYHGIVGGDAKRQLLKTCDAFVLLTHYPIEGQPISILEAMGNGMVIITTDHAGIPDIVQDGENGLVVSKDNINLEKCLEFLEHSCDYRKIATANRNTVLSTYQQKTYIENMNTTIKLAMDNKH